MSSDYGCPCKPLEKERRRTLKDLAMKIEKGESKEKGEYCLILSGFGYPDFDDDELIERYDATHFDVHWHERGVSVLVSFYKGDCFGCCSDMELVNTAVVILREDITKEFVESRLGEGQGHEAH